MKSRQCVGRVVRKGVRYPCPVSACRMGDDMKWRCHAHHCEEYPREVERESIVREDEPRDAA